MRGLQHQRSTLLSTQAPLEEQEPNTLLLEDATLAHGFVLLPKRILSARNLSRYAKLLYAVLLGYAWQEQRCWPGYTRLCADLDASENAVRKWMRELEVVHILSQRRRGLGLSNLYTLHDLRTAKIEVQEPHKTKVQEPRKTAGLDPQKSEDDEETREEETPEEKDRSIGERPARTSAEQPEDDGKALVEGVLAEPTKALPISPPLPTTFQRPTPTRGKQEQGRETSPRDQALAQAKEVVGAAIEERLCTLGGGHPEGGVERILEALVDAQTPVAVMGALLDVGERRLAQQQELTHIPNPTGYLISIMRNLAVEAWLKGWNLPHIQAEDEEKHAQALRSRGCAVRGAPERAAEETPTETSAAEKTAACGETETVEAQTQKDQEAAAREERAARAEAERYASLPIDPQARQIWQSTLERIRAKVSQSAYTTWFSGTKGVVLEDERLVVCVGSSFGREHLANRFHDMIESALSEQLGEPAEARFVIIPEAQEDEA
ncbi:MAG TPA: DnaA N-terminal domain-containing protein [Ktedonobacterales bacterium]